MKSTYLFPYAAKKYGWVLFYPSFIFGIYLLFGPEFEIKLPVFALINTGLTEGATFFTMTETNILDEVTSILLILSLFLIAFSKEKVEDELVAKIRLESLLWATYVNYAVLVLAILFLFEFAFYWVMILNMFTILLVFMLRFKWNLFQVNKELNHAE